MGRIDHETVQRILDAADIVEVVSDFVTLKRRGANYIGLCPFHNERTPSFSVSKSRGICKCFSCGKGGSPVNFLMELENMSYNEALRWLAKKYGIEIKEREMSDKDRAVEAERESLMAVNDFAMHYFEDYMADTDEGRSIGLAYFTERGINAQSIKKFHLGFGPERGDTFLKAAREKGYTDSALETTGQCARSDRGLYDRFRGRVIYPVFTLSGRVVAFGGRTLRSDKNIAKYVNSPESIIYSKSRELYGLYQARQAINRKNKCILVEGYMDVISMHQAGVENVVASSGTSLTEEQITLIHRFTPNVTVIYDSDAAGIKASLRGIDMLLAQGLDIKVLLLPDGDDPDSVAQSLSSEEVERYIEEHETDFIKFKSDILLRDAENDPVKRSRAISDIIHSISVIPNPITRSVYVEECSRRFGIAEKVLNTELSRHMANNSEEEWKKRQRESEMKRLEELRASERQTPTVVATLPSQPADEAKTAQNPASSEKYLARFERELLRYLVRYGVIYLCDADNGEGATVPMSVLEYIEAEMERDDTQFANKHYEKVARRIHELAYSNWQADYDAEQGNIAAAVDAERNKRMDVIRREARDVSDIEQREKLMEEDLKTFELQKQFEFARHYLEKQLMSDPDDDIRRISTELADDRYTLSKVHTKYAHVETEEERLAVLVPRAVFELKNGILTWQIREIQQQIANYTPSADVSLESLIRKLMELNEMKGEFAHYLGERIIAPGLK